MPRRLDRMEDLGMTPEEAQDSAEDEGFEYGFDEGYKAGERRERGRVVAFLREHGAGASELASMIERGEHKKEIG